MGSHALAGSFDPSWLAIRDEAGISLAEAMRAFGLDPLQIGRAKRPTGGVLAYLEPHIEQGPVLESLALPVGVVTAICGATRGRFHLKGLAGHAGTVPMGQRCDALAGAAEMMQTIESIATTRSIVATVGQVAVHPNAVNVIPGEVTFTLDLRAEQDALRNEALSAVDRSIAQIAERRGLSWDSETFHQSPSVQCAPQLQSVIADVIGEQGIPIHALPSGAGHDAMAIAPIAPVAMLFVRCTGGISHNPAESVMPEDAAVAARVLLGVLDRLATTAVFGISGTIPKIT
jgi:hydantoinase/carbamoylase family amidase